MASNIMEPHHSNKGAIDEPEFVPVEEKNHAQSQNQLVEQEMGWTPPMYPGTMELLAHFRAELKETELPYQKSLAQIAGIMSVMQDKCKELLIAFQYAEEQGDEVNHAAVLWQLTDAAALMRAAYQILYRAPRELEEEDAPQMSPEEYQRRMAGADLASIQVPDSGPR